MSTVIVRYRVKADRADENTRLIERVFGALERAAPDGLRYAAMVAEDGVSFTHIASIDTADDSNPLAELDEFQAFVSEIGERCEIPPAPVSQSIIGSYRAF